MPIEPEQVELHTRNNMVHETPYDSSIRERMEEDDDLGLSEGENKDSPEMIRQRRSLFRLSLSFFLFGLINNVLYVIILSAALDLVPPSTPKGIILFWNIAPSIVAKFSWPYILKGRIRYTRRLIGCCFLSVTGMIVVATSAGLSARLFGIGCASFAAGLGELTFLQLSTTFHPPSVAGRGVGYFASGTGAAGLAGAFLWWEIRGLGVRIGVGLSSVLPFVIPLTYFLLLPRPHAFSALVLPEIEDFASSRTEYAQLPVSEEDAGGAVVEPLPLTTKALSIGDKWQLLKPMIPRYMMPLFFVYLFEYTINQGVAPTLIYPIPTLESSPVFGRIIYSIRDYYPLWQLVYQSTVFLSRSSLSLGLPALPTRAISIPSIIQGFLLITLSSESALGYFPDSLAPGLVFLLISVEGICGGLSYVNAYFRAGQEPADAQERAFKMGAIGLADSLGILAASLVAMPTEISLCRAQVARGRSLCQEL
ncbi:batten's disease protein Cln3 [Russula ochroleuca]|jgi:battenin|uniref:Protein BTN n=1 Tax=Russula ochroleuca TaxID=152965 RepID=A0A9P5TBE3_9AGAM|nr:batten's disease protein Cln3 [Russula ochroleuca]